MKKTATLLAVVALAVGASGCSDDTTETETDETTETTEAPADAATGITVSGQWVRTGMAGGNTAAYMTIVAAEDDALVGAKLADGVAAKVELHETKMADGAMDGSTETSMDSMEGDAMEGGSMETTTTMAGMGEMQMSPVDKIDLPAGEKVSLEPGGYHVMIFELTSALEEGQELEITLDFENGEDQTVTFPIQADAG